MKTWLPVMLLTLTFGVILFALALVVYENLQVAPHSHEAAAGRLHHHMKNTTRFAGGPDQVRRQILRAVFLDRDPPRIAGASWRDEARVWLQVRAPFTHQVLLPGADDDSTLLWALPGLYWAVHAGCPASFTSAAPEPAARRTLLDTLAARAVPLFVLAPPRMIPDSLLVTLPESVPVSRVYAVEPAAHAVKVALVHDRATGFGWGRTHWRRDGYFEYVLATPLEPRGALAALPLARSNATAFLFVAADGSVPGVTDMHLWQQRPDWFVTPSEGPFRHLWIVGNLTTYATQGRLDHAFEKGPYPSKGPTALGPLEGLAVVFIVLGLACGLFVLVHGAATLPYVPLGMRLAWSATAALTPGTGAVAVLLGLPATVKKQG